MSILYSIHTHTHLCPSVLVSRELDIKEFHMHYNYGDTNGSNVNLHNMNIHTQKLSSLNYKRWYFQGK